MRSLSSPGQGGFGTVFKGQSKSTLGLVALKEIAINEDNGIPGSIMHEISVLKELNHEHIVSLYDIIYEEAKITLVFEYCDQDLGNFIRGHQGRLDPATVRKAMCAILSGVAFYHSRNFHHRDLKPANILVTRDFTLKIADFGLAKTFDLPIKIPSHVAGTLWYRAPEMLMGSTWSTAAVDIWPIGCIFAELLYGQPFFPGRDHQDQLHKIMSFMGTPSAAQYQRMKRESPEIRIPQYNYPKVPFHQRITFAPSGATDLLEYFLKLDPSERVSAAQALNHTYFTDSWQQNDPVPHVVPQQPPQNFNVFAPGPQRMRAHAMLFVPPPVCPGW